MAFRVWPRYGYHREEPRQKSACDEWSCCEECVFNTGGCGYGNPNCEKYETCEECAAATGGCREYADGGGRPD